MSEESETSTVEASGGNGCSSCLWAVLAGAAILIAITFLFVSCGKGGGGTPDLSSADRAVCDALSSTVAGMNATGVVDMGTLDSGWPSGQPSAAVRGAVNGFRSLQAKRDDYLAGVGTDAELKAAVTDALNGYSAACG